MSEQDRPSPQPSPFQGEGESTESISPAGRGQGEGAGRWKPYPAYKDSGVAWLGEVPEHWQVKRLKDIAFIDLEKLPENTFPNYELLYVDIGNVDSNGNISDLQNYIFEDAPSRARKKVRIGDTILSTVRTYLKAIAFIDEPPENMIVSTGFAVLHPKPRIASKYIWRLVQSQGFVDTIVAFSEGVSYPAITPSKLACIPVWVSSNDEQHAIAAFLDRETAKIDALIAKKQRLIELLQEKRIALISQALTKGLDPDAPMKDSGVEWLGKIPEHWEVKKLKFLSPESSTKLSNKPDELLYISLENIESNTGKLLIDNQQENVESSVNLFDQGDILFGKLRPYLAKVLLSDSNGACTTELLVMKPKDNVFGGYIFYLLLSDGFIKIINSMTYGAKMPRVNWQQIGCMKMPFPDIAIQRALASFLDGETAKIDNLISKVKAAIQSLQEYRTALISAAVTGKIDVRYEAAIPHQPLDATGGETPH